MITCYKKDVEKPVFRFKSFKDKSFIGTVIEAYEHEYLLKTSDGVKSRYTVVIA